MTAEFNKALAHYTRLAKTDGWYDYTRARVREMEADSSGMFKGLRAAVAASLKEAA